MKSAVFFPIRTTLNRGVKMNIQRLEIRQHIPAFDARWPNASALNPDEVWCWQNRHKILPRFAPPATTRAELCKETFNGLNHLR
jgi:hypothetical protein